jgi:hypothetical protein
MTSSSTAKRSCSAIPDCPTFGRCAASLAKRHADRLVYLAFDLLYLDGYDLRSAPLLERKRALQGLLAKPQAFAHRELDRFIAERIAEKEQNEPE